jgi:hypothetical protein
MAVPRLKSHILLTVSRLKPHMVEGMSCLQQACGHAWLILPVFHRVPASTPLSLTCCMAPVGQLTGMSAGLTDVATMPMPSPLAATTTASVAAAVVVNASAWTCSNEKGRTYTGVGSAIGCAVARCKMKMQTKPWQHQPPVKGSACRAETCLLLLTGLTPVWSFGL